MADIETRYTIRNIADFASVPADRLDDMLTDFSIFLRFHADVAALGLNAVTQRRDEFVWIDDGKHDAHVNITLRSEFKGADVMAESPSTPAEIRALRLDTSHDNYPRQIIRLWHREAEAINAQIEAHAALMERVEKALIALDAGGESYAQVCEQVAAILKGEK
jgi:hypothetical protein